MGKVKLDYYNKDYLNTLTASFNNTFKKSLNGVKVKKEDNMTETTQGNKTVYFCAGWFNEKQNIAYKKAVEALELNKSINFKDSYVPLQNQYKGIRVDEHPEYLHDKEWAQATMNGDLIGVKTSDICLAVYVPSSEDVGMGVELGIAKQLGKYIMLVIPDDEWGNPINLMSWGVADNAIKLSELKDYNFNQPKFNFYEGAVY